MTGIWIAALAIAATAAGVAKATVGSMIQEEVSTRLNRIPVAFIRLAVIRLPYDLRGELAAEWTAELEFVLCGTEGIPLTRLWRGIRFSAGLLLSARLITDGLTGVSNVQKRIRTPPRTVPSAWPDSSHVLTWRQRKILQVIRDSVHRRGYPPSMREIGEAVGLASTSSVSYQLSILERQGYLKSNAAHP
jgi:hypothetical protein